MKRKSMKQLILLSFVLILSLVGCAQSQPSETTDKPSQTNQPSQATETPKPMEANSPSPEQVTKITSISEQVKQSQHGKMFPTLLAQKEKNASFDYEDTCIRCHSETAILKDPNAKLSDFYKGGKYETERAGITCIVCHDFSGPNLVSLRRPGWESCTQCHTSGSLTLGKEVHHSQKQMIEGIGVGDVPNKPSYKWAAMKDSFSCTDCHITDSMKHDFMVPGVKATYDSLGTTRIGTEMNYTEFQTMFKQDGCIECHENPTHTIQKIQERQLQIQNKIELLKPRFEQLEKELSSVDPTNPKVIQYHNALTYFMYVTSDSSKGAHNYALSKALLERAEIELDKCAN